jgi:hypothetical protein
MRWRVRSAHGRRFAILLLAACLTADMAMPLMPGAFVWDTLESIAAVRAPSVQSARTVSDLPSHPSRHRSTLPVTAVAQTDGPRIRYAAWRPPVITLLPRFLPASETLGSSDAPDDH